MAAVCGEAKGPLHHGKATVRGPHGVLVHLPGVVKLCPRMTGM